MKRSPAAKDRTIREDSEKRLSAGTKRLGLSLSSTQIDLLLTYLSELTRWNRKVNLTAIRQEGGIVVKHFLDSLTPLTFLSPSQGARWIDIGSGAGFPGLVLKIARPDLKMTLVEAAQRKVTFLHHIIGTLGLAGISVVHDRLEHLTGSNWEGRFDLLTTRAVDPLLVLSHGKPLVRAAGEILFFQAESDREVWDLRLKDHPGVSLERIEPVLLPFDESRRTLILLKVA